MEFDPYPFQRRVADLLLSGKNVILQAPTGAGKTHAAQLAFCEAREQNLDFPRKCIYAVPMRVLANQFVAEAKDKHLPFKVAIQTGEHSDDRRFEAGMTFATIDQVLSSFLLTPYSLPRRLANINAGAIASSYLVFDEFHLFDPVSTLPTTLEMLRMLRGVVPFLLMTATFSQHMLQGLADALDAVVVPEDDDARRAMQALQSQHKTRRYHVASEPLSADAVLAKHRQRTLVICNVVSRAQALFHSLREHPALRDTSLRLLHSRFLPQDRADTEREIRSAYAKDADKKPSITVATQAIEVGLDITSDTLLTELAPANAILQRAGRCARYQNEQGDVFIYGETLRANGEPLDLVERCLPYRNMETECNSTLQAFKERDGCSLCFSDEQQLVTTVHGARDTRTVAGLTGAQETHRHCMNQVMRGDRSFGAGQLIRQVSSRRIIVHDDPRAVGENPFAYESFGLYAGTVSGLVKQWLSRAEQEDLDDYGIYALHDAGDTDQSGESHYAWLAVRDVEDLSGAALVMVHPRLATYDRHEGFVPNRGGSYTAKRVDATERDEWQRYAYQLEPYHTHAQLTLQACRHAWKDMAYAARRLEQKYGWRAGALKELAEVVALVHDTGKLTQGWQGWVRGYQCAIGQPVSQGFYAHTDSDPDNARHQIAARAQGRRPPHAVEGAVAVARLLVGYGNMLSKAAFTAIARHHGAFSETFQSYHLEPEANLETLALATELAPALSCLPHALITRADPQDPQFDLSDFWADPQYDDEYLPYVLLVRVLRLGDQAATAIGSQPCTEIRKEATM